MSNSSINFSTNFEKLTYKLKSYDKLSFESGWCSIPHSHPYCEILIITKGRGSFLSEQVSTPIKKGNIILTNPFISHTEYADDLSDTPLEYTVISLLNVTFVDENKNPLLNSKIIDAFEHWNTVSFYLNFIDREIANKKTLWEASVSNAIDNFMIFLFRYAHLENCYIPETNVDRNSHIVVPIKKYIDEFYPNNITLDDLAKQFYMNKYSLLRRFKEITGKTPIEYLEFVRVERAKQLIVTTNFSLIEIAIQTGFNNASYFSKKFKEIVGMTPTDYLKSQKNK